MNLFYSRELVACAVAAAALGMPALVGAAPYYYVDWTSANVAGGTATGFITLPDLSIVTVGFAATKPNGSNGNLYGAQTSGGINYWNPLTPYIGSAVGNAPPGTDLLQLSGGSNQLYAITFSEAVMDPIMPIVSLGQRNRPTTYDFDTPFSILSQGAGYWGGAASGLTQLPGDVLRGTEGHGTIRFNGALDVLSWTVPTPESWHGFTFGIRTAERLDPVRAITLANSVSEPSSVALLGIGLLGIAASRRRRKG